MKLRTVSDTLPPSGANPIVTGKYGLRGAKVPARRQQGITNAKEGYSAKTVR